MSIEDEIFCKETEIRVEVISKILYTDRPYVSSVLSDALIAFKKIENLAYEKVIKYHEKEIDRLVEMISENDQYSKEHGVKSSANDYIRDKINIHRMTIIEIQKMVYG